MNIFAKLRATGASKLRICLDVPRSSTCPVIYLIERTVPYFDYFVTRLNIAGDVLMASELTRLECPVHPVRHGNHLMIR